MSQMECGRRLAVNPRTIRRWLDDPAFRAAVEEEKLASNDIRPEDVLADLLLSPSESIRLQAARELRRGVSNPTDDGRDRQEDDLAGDWAA
jgi:hypothetical protein